MIDPFTAMAAVSSAVNLIKKAASTVDDVASLGPLLGKYFDAKHTAVKAVRESKNAAQLSTPTFDFAFQMAIRSA